MTILTGIIPEQVRAVHIINQSGTPALATAVRVGATECVIGKEDDFIQFRDTNNGKLLRVKINRIALIEMETDTMGDAGPTNEDIYTFD